jgi:uncharacterized membrane protein
MTGSGSQQHLCTLLLALAFDDSRAMDGAPFIAALVLMVGQKEAAASRAAAAAALLAEASALLPLALS